MDGKSINFLVNYNKGFIAAHSKLRFGIFELTKNDLKKIYAQIGTVFIQSENLIKIKTLSKLGDEFFIGSQQGNFHIFKLTQNEEKNRCEGNISNFKSINHIGTIIDISASF